MDREFEEVIIIIQQLQYTHKPYEANISNLAPISALSFNIVNMV